MSEHTEIWLEPKCAEDNRPEGRQWCQDAVFETCCECGEKPIRYIRADIVEAERQRQAEVMEEVRKVLEPFAAECATWPDDKAPDDYVIKVKLYSKVMSSKLRIGDLRAARALLSKLEGR